MDQVRRGVLFTAGIAGMMIVVLVFALVIYNNAINSRERTSEVGVIDRVSDVALSIKSSLRDIFNLEANINVTLDGKNIIFNEELPNDEDDDFRDDMNNFKDYLELEFKENPKVEINATKITDELPLVIKPNSITYTHPEGFGGKEINIIPEELKFNETVDMGVSNKFILDIGVSTIVIKIQNPGILIIENNAGKVEVKSKIYLNKL